MHLVTENLIRAHRQDLLRSARPRHAGRRTATRRHRFGRSRPAA